MTVVRIATPDDPRVADYRLTADPVALRRNGLFVAEGRLVVERLLELRQYRLRSILVTPTAFAALSRTQAALARSPDDQLHDHEAIGRDQSGVPVFVLDQSGMDAVVGFNIHRGCLALAERPPVVPLTALALNARSRVLVLEGVNNPDNVGGLVRSAAAFGVDAVVLGPGCGDPLYRKAIRTSMAATLQVPFADAGEWPQALRQLSDAGLRVLALTPAPDARPLDTYPRGTDGIALVVGNEGAGLSPAALAASDERIRIRMRPGIDSLNVTVAASIALHHFLGR